MLIHAIGATLDSAGVTAPVLDWATFVFAILLGFGSMIAGRLRDGGEIRTWAFGAAIIGAIGLALTEVLRWFVGRRSGEDRSADSQ